MQSRSTSIRHRSHPEGLSRRDSSPLSLVKPFCFEPIIDYAVYRVFMATVGAAESTDSKRDWWARYSRNRENYRAIAQRICEEQIGVEGVPFGRVTD
jgi:hypothetical protein